MGRYIPASDQERQEMLESMGLSSIDQLYAAVPAQMRVKELNLPAGLSELEVRQVMEEMAQKNTQFSSIFRGAGAYNHYIPSIVKTVTSKEEFVTAYTPYQAELSQGILQSIFEYQTMICELTGMEVSNASVYDGGSAAAEAVMMCQERKRSKAVVSGAVNPQVLTTIETYCSSRSVPVQVIPAKDGKTDLEAMAAAIDDTTACIYFQQPNFYGQIEDGQGLCQMAHEKGCKAIMGVNPIAMGMLQTPGECGADIAVGEGQPLGMSLAFGGPYLGFMASTQAMMRKLPGRIVGQTTDAKGNRAFVLTLQAREQHIRREKASSNICSNQALCAMTAAVYLAAMGPKGLAECAHQCYNKAHYAQEKLCQIPGVSLVYTGPYFHEFVTTTPVCSQTVTQKLAEKGILGGLPVEEGILWCVTEQNSKAQIDALVEAMKEVCA